MSWSRPVYDVKAYEQSLKESQAPGAYYSGTPIIKDFRAPNTQCEKTQCYSFMPGVAGSGVSTSKKQDYIQVENDLIGLTFKNTNDQEIKAKARNPNTDGYSVSEGLPAGGGVINSVKCNKGSELKEGQRIGDDMEDYKECGVPAEETRISNPASNRRGTGYNRWEHLDRNPQETFEVPRSGGIFAPTVSTRIIVKDNHRPCLPKLMDNDLSLPTGGPDPACSKISNACEVPTNSLHPYYVQQRESCFCKS